VWPTSLAAQPASRTATREGTGGRRQGWVVQKQAMRGSQRHCLITQCKCTCMPCHRHGRPYCAEAWPTSTTLSSMRKPVAVPTFERCRRDVLLHVTAQQRQHVANVREHHICLGATRRVKPTGCVVAGELSRWRRQRPACPSMSHEHPTVGRRQPAGAHLHPAAPAPCPLGPCLHPAPEPACRGPWPG